MPTEPHISSSSSGPASFIPIMSSPVPRAHPSRSAVPSSLSLSQLSLIPTSRLTRNPSSSPLQASPSSISSASSGGIGESPMPIYSPTASTPASGIPKFRALRNMLPFGPKSATAANVIPNLPTPPVHRRSASSSPSPKPRPSTKNNFMTFGSRGSITIERNAPPSSFLPPPEIRSPIISIEPPRPEKARPQAVHDSSQLVPQVIFHPEPQRVPHSSIPILPDEPEKGQDSEGYFLNAEQDLGPPGGDLSTILESDTSGVSMSRHIPPSDTSQDEREVIDLTSPEHVSEEKEEEFSLKDMSEQEPESGLFLSRLARQLRKRSESMMREESLDFSTSSSGTPIPTGETQSRTWSRDSADFPISMGQLRNGNNSTRPDEQEDTHAGDTTMASNSNFGIEDDEETQKLGIPRISPITSTMLTPASDRSLNFEDEKISFDLSSLDPDLAALLSPHNVPPSRVGDPAILAAVASVPPPPPLSLSPSPEPQEVSSSGSPMGTDNSNASAEQRTRAHTIALGPQSSPPRRSRPTSLALSVSSHSTASARRVSLDNPTAARSTPGSASPLSPALVVTESEVTAGRSGSSSGKGRPWLARSFSAAGPHSSATDSSRKRPVVPRIFTPSRTHSGGQSSSTASDRRPSVRSYNSSASESHESASNPLSPTARSSSSLSTTAPHRKPLQYSGRSSIDDSSARPDRTIYTRSRKRSSSVSEARFSPFTSTPQGNRRPAAEWLGPRTAKAFAAAGLLDHDKERDRDTHSNTNENGPGPRFGSFQRGISERDFGSRSVSGNGSTYAPSRLGFSDISASASWGRGGSRTMTIAELASMRGESPATTSSGPTTASHSRTALSTSTATSVSMGSPRQLEAAVQSLKEMKEMKEKHASETEALLSALADSQRTTKVLRDENGRLRNRIMDLEDQLRDVVDNIKAAPPPSMRSRPSLTPPLNQGSAELASSRHPLMHSFLPPSHQHLPDPPELGPAVAQDTPTESMVLISPASPSSASGRFPRRRFSTASSVFPVVPNNMSLLMQEEGESADQSGLYTNSQPRSCSGSPTQSPTHILRDLGWGRHAAQPSVSSTGNISPTTADFSMSMTGSPGSLHLRPEHERHLGDMISFDLSGDDPDG